MMAEQSEDGQEKTEEPTAKKLEKAAEEGQVLSSKEMFVFTGVFVMFGLVYILPYFSQMLISYWSMFFDWSDIVNDKKSILDILYYALNFFVGAVTNIILNYFFIPSFGISGAAYSTILTYLLIIFLFDIFNKKTRVLLKIKYKSIISI